MSAVIVYLLAILGLVALATLGLMGYVAVVLVPRTRKADLAVRQADEEIDALLDEFESEELAREVEAIRAPTLAEQYQADVNNRLAWNMANAHLYKQGELAVISVSYDKTSKGKTRKESTVLGVVPKADVTKLILDVESAWLRHENHLWASNKPAPSVSNLEFISFVPYIGWRRGEHVITDLDIEEKHGRIDHEKAFKQLKSL